MIVAGNIFAQENWNCESGMAIFLLQKKGRFYSSGPLV